MTEVAFHVNLPDRLAYACRLLRKAVGAGAKVVVTGAPESLRALDAALWTFSAQDFIPHGMVGVLPEPLLARTPVLLAVEPARAPHRQVLVNLGDQAPEGFEAFARVIELVSADPADLQQARVRWKQYAAQGITPVKHERKEDA